ncbi:MULTISPECIES: TetR/AcrR family transcriptional regulator [unclassified Cellulomonas]|uniref:TetR/AcrR family transcriptional regulator n=1 Tax=unclassified Cellulomonas TaxID=2620175 RepID=UPI0019A1D71C|nr:TetR/AcrR family transcriptional regulator [Cellulomonas sp. ES6]MBD3778606.1 TetR/AcrR family transcriptional regulator [Micrococcales bacterium]WHP17099.1 TetR/AcrR family transcriptional regulator [Cellulomonas sp. ES6]
MDQPPTGRGRPVRMPRALRRAQVLRIAQELFTSEGFHHVSMDDIAERAEVSKPVLYRHFPSKLDLYLTVVDARGEELLSAVDAAVAEHPAGEVRPHDARAVITGVVRAYLDFVDRAGESSALLFESDVRHDDGVRARVERATAVVTSRVEAVLSGVAGVPHATAALLAPSVAAIAQEAATRRLRTPGPPSARETASLVARLAWGGVAGFVPGLSAEGEREPQQGGDDARPA